MPGSNDLIEREREILSLVAKGSSNKEIARDLNISTNTVNFNLRNIFTKVGANSRTEATLDEPSIMHALSILNLSQTANYI